MRKGQHTDGVLSASLAAPIPPARGGNFPPESVATFDWNQWQVWTGISGSFQPESVATFDRNTQSSLPILQEDGVMDLEGFA
jgi:hypothetical protein